MSFHCVITFTRKLSQIATSSPEERKKEKFTISKPANQQKREPVGSRRGTGNALLEMYEQSQRKCQPGDIIKKPQNCNFGQDKEKEGGGG